MNWKSIKIPLTATPLYHYTALFLCLFLTSCGFRPLYTSSDVCGNICFPIKIATISERNGQILRNYLVDLLTPQGAHPKPKYILEVTLTETLADTVLNKDETTNRKQVTFMALLTLRDSKCNKVVYAHSTKSINSFPVLVKNYFSDYVAQDFARREALRLLAEKITLFVTAYFDSHIPRG
jgi:hypothetical protein